MKSLSLIILTYNSQKDIYDCLKSVYDYNDIGEELEIIVVDNNSPCFAEMKTKIQSEYPNVITIANKQNGGYGQGNNVGIRAAHAPVIAIMNPDVRLIMPVFKSMLQTLSKKDVVMCGGKQYNNYNKPALSYFYDHNAYAILQSIAYLFLSKLDIYDYRKMWLSGAFFAIKKDIFIQIGLFDERIFMYGEEFDMHTRLRRMFPRLKVVYLPQIKYIHLISDRRTTLDSAYKTYKSDVFVCTLLGISPQQCIRRKKRSLHIMHIVNIILCALRRVSMDGRYYKFSMQALRQLESEYSRHI